MSTTRAHAGDLGEPSKDLIALEAAIGRRRRLLRLCQALVGIVFFAFWEWSSGRLIDPFFVTAPSAVADRLYDWAVTGRLFTHLGATLYATAWGFAIGAAVGFSFGLMFGRFEFVAAVFDPYITAIYSIPKIALAPLFIMWFGIGIESKIAVSASIVFFVIFLNTYAGARDVQRIHIDGVRIMGGNEWHVLRYVIVPSAAAWVTTGLKVSVPYALVGTVIGEFMSANRGIGFIIAQATGLFDTTSVFAGLIVLAIVGALINGLIKRLESWLLRWRR